MCNNRLLAHIIALQSNLGNRRITVHYITTILLMMVGIYDSDVLICDRSPAIVRAFNRSEWYCAPKLRIYNRAARAETDVRFARFRGSIIKLYNIIYLFRGHNINKYFIRRCHVLLLSENEFFFEFNIRVATLAPRFRRHRVKSTKYSGCT